MSMRLPVFAAALLLLAPASAFAAVSSFSADRSLITASSSPGNAYAAGASVIIAAPVGGDLSAVAGTLVVTTPIAGDALVAGGSVHTRARITGDLRAFGGSITVERPIGGDFSAIGFSVHGGARPSGSVFIIAARTDLVSGASGPVMIYGNDISLAGDFGSDVTLMASGRVTLAASTTIAGTLRYEAPEPAVIPESVRIAGGIEYASTSYLPNSEVAHRLAVASLGIFLLARIVGALILAGLLAGLFPKLAEAISHRAATASARTVLLTMLLGFAALVATPIFLLLMALTFVGIGIALLLLICYALLTLLAYLYAGIVIGSQLARRFGERTGVLWRDGVLGMLALSVIGLIPILGWIIVFLITTFTAGSLILLFFHFAFPKDSRKSDLV